jgi:nickel-dependent lactate racemase
VIVKLPFGTDTLAVDLRGLRVRPLLPSAPRGFRDLRALMARAVDRPLDGRPLREIVAGRNSAVILVPDVTRRADLPEILPVVFDRLLSGGLDPASITVLVACGTHPPAAEAEIAALVGELPEGVALRQHSSRNDAGLRRVGELRSGLSLRMDRQVVECDLLITVGAVKHHYFAGFGGGPKMVFPGVGGHGEIQANHSLVLRNGCEGPERHPGCEPGVLEGNPVAEEIARAADLRPPDLAICLVHGRDGRVAWVGAGGWRTAFEAAVSRAREWYELAPERFDLVVASGGGDPADATLIQAHKGLDAACRFANPGAEVIFAAELGKGGGSPAMDPYLADPRPESILEDLARRYVQYGHTTLRIIEKTRSHRVHLKSNLHRDLALGLGFQPIEDIEGVVDRWRRSEDRSRVGVLAEGAVWPRVTESAT